MWVIIIAVVVLAGVAYYMGWIPLMGGSSAVKGDEAPAVNYAWVFTELEPDQTGMPQTAVALMTGGKAYEIGTFDGTCSEQESDLLAGQKEKVVCWWAGGGKEIGVFNEGGKVLVKVGDVDEGDLETGGFRGNFKTVITL